MFSRTARDPILSTQTCLATPLLLILTTQTFSRQSFAPASMMNVLYAMLLASARIHENSLGSIV